MTAPTQAYVALLALFMTAILIAVATHPQFAPAVEYQSTGLRIDVNTADASTLTLLPGVGPGIAEHIILARQGGTVFRSADDLQAVKFIGPKLVARIDPWVVYQTDTDRYNGLVLEATQP